MRVLHRVYAPLFDVALRNPRKALLLSVAPLLLCVLLFPLLGEEFMPKLEEGNLWIRATLPNSISLEESAQHVKRMRRIVRGCSSDLSRRCVDSTRRHPQVVAAISQVGRPDDGTDVTGFNNIEIFAPLRPFDDASWHGRTKPELVDELTRELKHVGAGVLSMAKCAATTGAEARARKRVCAAMRESARARALASPLTTPPAPGQTPTAASSSSLSPRSRV